MCSISGIWRLNGKPVLPHEIKKFNDSTAYRGPDGEGTFIDERKNLALGHRRLSILDLSEAGKQPMFSADGNLVITFNGEIYNYIELKAELARKGHSFKTGTDTEVILAAYQEWGEDCNFRFNGMWAFAIWDIAKGSLFISRDRFGVKPVYYVHKPGKLFAFASETVAFKNLAGFTQSFHHTNIDLAIRNSFYLEPTGETIYEDVIKLFPGHYLKIELSKPVKQVRWWKLEDHLHTTLPTTYEDQVSMFRDIFTDACKLRLRSDVPVGVALSGGLDSSAIYSTIQNLFHASKIENKEQSLSWQNAFIACFPDTKMDEQYYADEVVNFTRGKANYIYPIEADISSSIYESTKAEDYIYMSPPIVHSIYREMRAKNIKVSLDGHGADEMLFGYAHMVNDLIDHRSESHEHEMLIDVWSSMTGATRSKVQQGANITSMEKTSMDEMGTLTKYIPEKYKRIYRNLLRRNRKNTSWLLHNPQFISQQHTTFTQFADRGTNICYNEMNFHLPTLLRNWDRASMRHGVEIRMPFLDWRLVTYVMSLPDTAKVNHGYTKKIVRDAMQGIMPDTVRLRKSKIGINAPVEEWFNGPMSNFLLDVVNSNSFKNSTIWNGTSIRDFIEKKTKAKQWTQHEAMTIWPYLNAWILMN